MLHLNTLCIFCDYVIDDIDCDGVCGAAWSLGRSGMFAFGRLVPKLAPDATVSELPGATKEMAECKASTAPLRRLLCYLPPTNTRPLSGKSYPGGWAALLVEAGGWAALLVEAGGCHRGDGQRSWWRRADATSSAAHPSG